MAKIFTDQKIYPETRICWNNEPPSPNLEKYAD